MIHSGKILKKMNKSKIQVEKMSIQELKKKNLALCIDAGEHKGVSLFELKLYEFIPEPDSEAKGLLRVIDEEGEPYYYDSNCFLKVKPIPDGLAIPILPASSSLPDASAVH